MKNILSNKTFKHLTNEDRVRIEVLLTEGYTQISIAQKLEVDRSTISREINNRGTPSGYHAKIAQVNYQRRRQKCHPKSKIEETPIGSFIIAKIRAGWSPETISCRLRREIDQGLRLEKDFITKETIYQFIYNSDFGQQEKLYQYLRHGKKHRTKKFGRKSKKQVISNRIFIDERPPDVESRQSVGHWEGDAIIYKYKNAIQSIVERKLKYTILNKLMRKTAELSTAAFTNSLKGHYVESLTVDNGSENKDHQKKLL